MEVSSLLVAIGEQPDSETFEKLVEIEWGLIVADEIFFGRVPAELTAQQHADVAQVAGTHFAVMRKHVGHGFAAVFHAVEEVLHVTGHRTAEQF